MPNKIIGLCGRKESGKTELANCCLLHGYSKLSFATPLKKLIAQLISCNVEDINSLKNVTANYIFGNVDFDFISTETNIPYEIVKEKMNDKIFKNVRELLQFIGTDLIRCYNKDWHVQKTKELIEPNSKYVIDDVRFPNEVNMIKELGGDCWFIVRPKIDNISNHESETSLKWQDFDKIIINDKTLEYLKFNWCLFFENGYDFSCEKRENILKLCYSDKEYVNKVIGNENEFTLLDNLFIYKHIFEYDDKFFNNEKITQVLTENNELYVHLNNGELNHVTNPLMIEDIKKYIN